MRNAAHDGASRRGGGRGSLVSRGGAAWAAGYLVAVGSLLAIAGAALSGPSPEERARTLERRTARELAAVVETAAAVARSRAADGARRASEREAALAAGLSSVRSWARRLEALPEHGELPRDLLRDRLGPAGPELESILPPGVAAAIIAPNGEKLLEAGGAVDLDSPHATTAQVWDGITVAVGSADEAPGDMPHEDPGLSDSLRGTFGAGLEPGSGLYLVDEAGSIAVEVFPRPAPAMPVGAPLAAGAGGGVVKSVKGDLGTGRLVSARRTIGPPAGEAGSLPRLTAVAERFLSSEVLAAGSKGVAGTLALAGLGVVAAAAFAHAFHAGSVRTRAETGGAPSGAALSASASGSPGAGPAGEAPAGTSPVGRTTEPDPGQPPSWQDAPSGASIVRLRESLGAAAEGPDLAACARSPILRALSRCVRQPGPAPVPREVGEWAKRALGEDTDRGRKVA